jgi:hypothetical protein
LQLTSEKNRLLKNISTGLFPYEFWQTFSRSFLIQNIGFNHLGRQGLTVTLPVGLRFFQPWD